MGLASIMKEALQRFSGESGFHSVLTEESQEFLPEIKYDGQHPDPVRERNGRRRRSLPWLLTSINVILFILSACGAYAAYRWKYSIQHNHNNAIHRLTTWYSPVYDQAQIDIVDVRVNGSLLDMDGNLFRSPPSPEVDAAWERISSLMPHVISTEDVIRLGKDPSKTARYTEDWGFGPDAHVAELDILHTIHCLNAIRRDVYWQHYFGKDYPDGNFPELHRVHTDHCIYIVLQNLMCSATGDIITQPWVDGQLHPFPDFSINRKCNDFDAILAWHESTMVTDVAKFETLRAPPGHTPYPMSEEFHRMFGSNPHGDGHGHEH